MKTSSALKDRLRSWADRVLTKENGRRLTQGLVDSYTRTAGPRWADRCCKGLREQGFDVETGGKTPRSGWATGFALGVGLGLFAGAVVGTTASELGNLRGLAPTSGSHHAPKGRVEESRSDADAELLARIQRVLEEARRESEIDAR